MNYIEKEKLIKEDLAIIENTVRHAFNQGYDLGYKKGKMNRSEIPTDSTTKNDLAVDWESYKDVDGNSLDDLILEVLQNNFDCGNTYGYKVADEIIGLLPSVTPQEPRKGHWEHGKELSKEYRGRILVDVTYADWHCSNCHCVIEESIKPKWNYCPGCGAKMQEVEV